jgi:hypothetical protein
MMKQFCIGLVLLGLTSVVTACDICGSGAGSYYAGLLPAFKKKFIGLRYQLNGLQSHLGANGQATYLTNKERFQIMELWGAASVGKRFRITASVPASFLERTNQAVRTTKSGLSDVSVLGYYQVLKMQQTTNAGNVLAQSLWLGTGIKLPVGKYNAEDKNTASAAQNTFQLGTGSTDFSFNMLYDVRLQDAGINTNIIYKINSRNKYGYQYGNKFSGNLLAYYQFRPGTAFSIIPNTGVLYETSAKDWETKTVEVFQTGGYSMMGTAGVEIAFKKIGMGANVQTPLMQQLGEGKIKSCNRGMLYVSYSF